MKFKYEGFCGTCRVKYGHKDWKCIFDEVPEECLKIGVKESDKHD